jgi:RimJ/RimL family protein N-acetyltransferase
MNVITTERLVIRRFTRDDWQDLYEYLSNKNVVFYEPYDVLTEEQCKEEAINRSNNESFWAVCLKNNNKVIGNIYFAKQDFDTWELGYVFNEQYHKHGYATESAKAMLGNAFTQLGARRIIAMCSSKNEPSWKLLERLNMRREGHQMQNIYFKKDENNQPIWLDTYEYALLVSEWEEK